MRPTVESLGIDRLSLRERLDLIEQIGDTLPASIEPEEIPEWHLAELSKRRIDADANPKAGRPKREVLASLRSNA